MAPIVLVPIVIIGAAIKRMVTSKVAKTLVNEGLVEKIPASAVKNAKNIPRASEKQVRNLADEVKKPGGRVLKVRQPTPDKRLQDAWVAAVGPRKSPPPRKLVDKSEKQEPSQKLLDAAWIKAVKKRNEVVKKLPDTPKKKVPPKKQDPDKNKKTLTPNQFAALLTGAGIGGVSIAALTGKDEVKRGGPPIPNVRKDPSGKRKSTELPPLEKKTVATLPEPKAVARRKTPKKDSKLTKKEQNKLWREIKKISKALGVKYEVPIDDEHGVPLDPDMRIDSNYKGGLVGKSKKVAKPKSKRKTSSTKKRKGFGGKGSGAALRGY